MSYYILTRASQIRSADRIRVGEFAGTVVRVALSPALPADEENDYQPEMISTTVDTGRGCVVGFELFPDEYVERLTEKKVAR